MPASGRNWTVTRRSHAQMPGVLWTCSIFPLFAPKGVRRTVLPPGRCGNGHELTLDNLVLAERGTRWRCRQCGSDRAAVWRRKRTAAA
jgi:hypothetical protein